MGQKSLHAFLLGFIVMCASDSWAQKAFYFIDHPEVPPASGYRAGYIVTLNGNTIAGRLGNTESLGKILTPDKLYIGSDVTVQLVNNGEVSKIVFIPNGKNNSSEQKFGPEDIRAFGDLSAFSNRQVIDLDAEFNQNGFLNFNTIRKTFSHKRRMRMQTCCFVPPLTATAPTKINI